jgi:hypothetical protein
MSPIGGSPLSAAHQCHTERKSRLLKGKALRRSLGWGDLARLRTICAAFPGQNSIMVLVHELGEAESHLPKFGSQEGWLLVAWTTRVAGQPRRHMPGEVFVDLSTVPGGGVFVTPPGGCCFIFFILLSHFARWPDWAGSHERLSDRRQQRYWLPT